MPRFKKPIGYVRCIVTEEVREETHWCQIVGNTIVRCDNDAKNTGSGLWTTEDINSRGRSSWIGVYFGLGPQANAPDPAAWFREDHVYEYISEKDVS